MAYKLVGYYENWAQYRPEGKGKCLPDQIDPSLLTHINFAFGFFGFITRSVDPKNPRLTGNYKIEPVEWNDQTVLYPALQKLKQKNPNLKTLLSIGGWSFNDPQDTNGIGTFTYKLFSQMASSAAGRKEFIDSVIAYAHKYGFDGIDLDWEYPGDRTRGGTDSDYDNFLALLKEFRSAINNDGQKLLLTIASPAIKKGEAKTSEQFFAWLAQCAAYLDWLNVMTYDYHGAFPDDKVTGVNAPLLQDSTPGGTFSVRHTVETYLAAGIPKEKMVLGMPTYGRTFKVTSPLTDTDNGPGKPYSGPGDAGKATQTPGFLAYYEILERLSNGDLKRGWDKATLTPYAYSKNGEWITYDDAESLGYKVSYLIEKELAGAMIWAIDNDDFFNASSHTEENISRALVSDSIAIFSLLVAILAILLHPETRPPLPSGWSDDKELPYGTSGTPAVAAYNGLLYCVHEAKHEDGWLWYTTFDGNEWSGDTKLPKHGTSHGQYRRRIPSAALAVYNGLLYCVHQGQEQEQFGKLWYTTFNGDTWSEDRELPNHGTFGGPALAVYNGLLYCVHEGQPKASLGSGNSASLDRDMWLWYTTFDGHTWSEDRKLPNHGTSGPPGLAVYDGRLYCIHEGQYEDGWLWYTTFDGDTWSNDTKLPYGTSRPPALAVYKGKLYCVHEGQGEKGSIWWTVLSLPNSNTDWIEARGANSYCYYSIDSLGTKGQRVETSKTITVDAGAPFLCAVLIKNNYSVDFPTGAMLTITGPDGSVYNRDSDGKMPLVFDSDSSLRGLLVKNPLPGDWIVSLKVPVGVEFDFEFETLPSQDVDDTIENTLKPIYLKPSESPRLQKRQLAKSGGGDDIFLRMIAARVLAALWEMASNSAPSERQQATSSTSQAVIYATSSRLDISRIQTPLPEATETIAVNMAIESVRVNIGTWNVFHGNLLPGTDPYYSQPRLQRAEDRLRALIVFGATNNIGIIAFQEVQQQFLDTTHEIYTYIQNQTSYNWIIVDREYPRHGDPDYTNPPASNTADGYLILYDRTILTQTDNWNFYQPNQFLQGVAQARPPIEIRFTINGTRIINGTNIDTAFRFLTWHIEPQRAIAAPYVAHAYNLLRQGQGNWIIAGDLNIADSQLPEDLNLEEHHLTHDERTLDHIISSERVVDTINNNNDLVTAADWGRFWSDAHYVLFASIDFLFRQP